MKKNQKNKVVNLGCRLNDYESSVISSILDKNDADDVIVVNTCAVTKMAEKKSKKEITKIKRENPDKKIIATGCAVQLDPVKFAKMPQIHSVIGNSHKTDSKTYANLIKNNLQKEERVIVNDIMSITETAGHLMNDTKLRSRAFLQIQNGCDHRCTFCIIPYARGNSRSVPMTQIIENIDILVEKGYNEIVLTGVDITDYGSNLPNEPNLGNLCKRILSLTKLKRLRLSSVDVAEIDENLMDLIKNEERFMPYFHISLQAGDDLTLKRMKRRHLRQDVIDFCENVRKFRPNAGFGADIICGFPTETDEMFQNTMKLIQKTKIQYIHAFTYSARLGTPAAKMPQVDGKIAKNRTNQLIKLGQENLHNFLKTMINTEQTVVLEKGMNGKAENFADIKFINENEVREHFSPGNLLKCKCVKFESNILMALAEI